MGDAVDGDYGVWRLWWPAELRDHEQAGDRLR